MIASLFGMVRGALISGTTEGKAASFAFLRNDFCGIDLRCFGKAGSFAYGGNRP
jgi:hypothetical protein